MFYETIFPYKTKLMENNNMSSTNQQETLQNGHTSESNPVANIDYHPIQSHHMIPERTNISLPLPSNENVVLELITKNQDQSIDKQSFSHSPRRSNKPKRTPSYLQDFICQQVTTSFDHSNEAARKKEPYISGNPYPFAILWPMNT